MKKVCSLLLVMVLLLSVCQSALAARPKDFKIDVTTTESYHYSGKDWALFQSNRKVLFNSMRKDLNLAGYEVDTSKKAGLTCLFYMGATKTLNVIIPAPDNMYYKVSYTPGETTAWCSLMD